MTTNQYIRYADSIEVKQPDEDQLIDNIVASMARVNRQTFDKHRHATRDAHVKSHGILKGVLSVYSDLPDPLRQGLFSAPKDYPVVVRFSSAPGDFHADEIRAPKGMAIKVIGVTQDLLLVNLPVIAFGHAAAYWDIQQKVEKHADDPEIIQRLTAEAANKLSGALGLVGRQSPILEGLGASNHHILGETFYSMAALRYGDYVAKICAAPLSESVRQLTGKVVETKGHPSVFRDLIVDFFKSGSAEYELRAQLCTDLHQMPVEDASVEWPESLSPYQPVAKLTFAPQDAYSPARRVYADDVISFNPWRCLPEHRPLGSIMRARIKAYEESTRFRHEMNVQPRVEPQDITEVPD